MSLNWSIEKVADYKSLWVPSPVEGQEDREVLHGVTEALIWVTMTVDLGSIKKDNVDEWCWRLAYLEACGMGKMLNEWNEAEGKYAERNFTRAEVERHVGLTTNASTLTRTQFLAKVARILKRKADAIASARYVTR